jgi:hypothetical protein
MSLIVSAVLLMGLGQPAFADETYNSWSYYSYYTVPEWEYTLKQEHKYDAGKSEVVYDVNNYAKSSVGFGSDGSLDAKIGVSIYDQDEYDDKQLLQVYSESLYRDDGFVCDADTCGTAVPLVDSFEVRLQQDGRFSPQISNYSLSYYLLTPSTAYSFDFGVWYEGSLGLSASFSETNLITGAHTERNLENEEGISFFNWNLDEDDQGMYNFSYDFSFDALTSGIGMGESLTVRASAFNGSRIHFFDSYNSFHASITPDEGVSFYRGGQLLVGTSDGNPGPQALPEPTSMVLLGSGLVGMLFRRKFGV